MSSHCLRRELKQASMALEALYNWPRWRGACVCTHLSPSPGSATVALFPPDSPSLLRPHWRPLHSLPLARMLSPQLPASV